MCSQFSNSVTYRKLSTGNKFKNKNLKKGKQVPAACGEQVMPDSSCPQGLKPALRCPELQSCPILGCGCPGSSCLLATQSFCLHTQVPPGQWHSSSAAPLAPWCLWEPVTAWGALVPTAASPQRGSSLQTWTLGQLWRSRFLCWCPLGWGSGTGKEKLLRSAWVFLPITPPRVGK